MFRTVAGRRVDVRPLTSLEARNGQAQPQRSVLGNVCPHMPSGESRLEATPQSDPDSGRQT